jgi:CHAD domain
VRARRISGLDPDGSLADNLRRIVEVRLDELRSFVPRALDPDEQRALHDMRIAAKRLRYVLELSVPAFGEPAAKGAKVARRLQDLLGEIHDCDELLPRARAHVRRLRAQDAEALRAAAGRGRDLDPALVREAPNRAAYRGLESLIAYLTARRAVLFERFVRDWDRLERRAFGETLLAGLRPPRPEVSAAERAPAARAGGGAA